MIKRKRNNQNEKYKVISDWILIIRCKDRIFVFRVSVRLLFLRDSQQNIILLIINFLPSIQFRLYR